MVCSTPRSGGSPAESSEAGEKTNSILQTHGFLGRTKGSDGSAVSGAARSYGKKNLLFLVYKTNYFKLFSVVFFEISVQKIYTINKTFKIV